MIEENRTKLSDSAFKFAFRWGSIIGFFTLIYYIIGFFTGWDKLIYFSDIYFLIEVILLVWMMVMYSRERSGEEIKFSRYVQIGFYATIVIAIFYTIYFAIRVFKLDPFFIQNYISQFVDMAQQQFGEDYSMLSKIQVNATFKVAFLFTIFVSNIISNMFYILLLSLFMMLNKKIYRR